MKLNVIFEDEYIIIAEKPVGMASQSDITGDESLFDILYKHTEKKYLGLVHRLDRPVGGIMVFAKNKKSNAFLSKQIQERQFDKKYLAVVCGETKESDVLENYLIKNQRLNISKSVNKNTANSKYAQLEYKTIDKVNTEEYGILSFVYIKLFTGRHHQIRVQFSDIGIPLWGDIKYNDAFKHKKTLVFPALWAYEISFNHPCTNKKVTFKLKPNNVFPFNLFSENKFYIN